MSRSVIRFEDWVPVLDASAIPGLRGEVVEDFLTRGVGVTETPLDRLDVDSLDHRSGGVGAAEVMELDPLQACFGAGRRSASVVTRA
jgi:hypothetical protein